MRTCNVCGKNLETKKGDETFKIRLLIAPLKNLKGKGILTSTLGGDYCIDCATKKVISIKS